MTLEEYLDMTSEKWSLTGKKQYTVRAGMVSAELSFHNELENADYTVRDDGETVVLKGTAGEMWTSPLSKVKSWIFGCAGLLLIAYFFLWLTPLWERIDGDYTGADFGKYAAAFGIGLGVLLALPIAAIILMITGFGLRPAFMLLFLYGAAVTASPIFLGFILGSLLWRRAFKRARNYWAELAIGIAVLRVVTLVPYVSGIVSFVSVAFGVGAAACLLGKKRSAPPALPEQAA